jgi:hypothetical protein
MSDKQKEIPVETENEPVGSAEENPMDRFFFHQRRALEEMGKALQALLPPETRKHGGEASKEFAKGFRVLIDATIDELKKVSEREEEAKPATEEKKDDDDQNRPASTGKTKVKVKLD